MSKRLLSLLVAGAVIFSAAGCGINVNNAPSQGASSETVVESSFDEAAEKERIILELAQSYIDDGDYDSAKRILSDARQKYESADITDKLFEVQAKIDEMAAQSSLPESSPLIDDLSSALPEESSQAESIDYASKFIGTYYLDNGDEETNGKITIKRKSDTKISFHIVRNNVANSTEFTQSVKVGSKNYFRIKFDDGAAKYEITVKLQSKGILDVEQDSVEIYNYETEGCFIGGYYCAK